MTNQDRQVLNAFNEIYTIFAFYDDEYYSKIRYDLECLFLTYDSCVRIFGDIHQMISRIMVDYIKTDEIRLYKDVKDILKNLNKIDKYYFRKYKPACVQIKRINEMISIYENFISNPEALHILKLQILSK